MRLQFARPETIDANSIIKKMRLLGIYSAFQMSLVLMLQYSTVQCCLHKMHDALIMQKHSFIHPE